ncbi:sulfite exporter TauE/SafE family protein [Geobacter sp. DSM 9736]|uniref:sulfite exporter TauE/SafE family protein n=1 Tax=Geobacter sp. DSM 9736 TaxID=1277350 RepID=UPI000B4FEA1A|nr:sulfite exporter TauE/SafE family protein [Geobacter sp. DSM 9736]SNB46542.1 hypothetical protein SAMN06269301_2010 [Geobacter sp. DSM 9736]
MDPTFLKYALIGFVAQLIDGALGMAYGVISTTFLLSAGIAPAAASASVHTAQVITAVSSGFSHLLMGNVDRILLRKLLLFGAMGAVAGSYAITLLPLWHMRFIVSGYLAVMGGVIILKAVRSTPLFTAPIDKATRVLGLTGGFLDGAGGGGWGPIVTSTLLNRGHMPRFVIGTVSLAEIFVSLAAVLTFSFTIGIGHWRIVLGLISGGVVAAPLAAYFCRRIPPRIVMVLVGIVIIVLCTRTMLVSPD